MFNYKLRFVYKENINSEVGFKTKEERDWYFGKILTCQETNTLQLLQLGTTIINLNNVCYVEKIDNEVPGEVKDENQ